ncbi:hypothetical protein AKJ43_02420 [candidate division MSBL1 archaeon SCGC-AAA261D19]|uniref:Uncharacterized protein n=1 Tax=candidate division MSBL1 archaeon SCGC-AAA261D19 TaxID=1698273 RepID=A0A133V6N7_9EURY|nr:hypothetical protein AKJ43_02420 [candidate division MSBL1 archaeon SCGC-AAA261D19]
MRPQGPGLFPASSNASPPARAPCHPDPQKPLNAFVRFFRSSRRFDRRSEPYFRFRNYLCDPRFCP